jgi:uncharacterized protein (TIGR00299 family) protein
MRTLFVDATAGAAGDMILGALVDLGLPLARLRRALGTLPLGDWTLRSRKVVRHGLVGRKIDVRPRDRQPRRGWKSLEKIIGAGELDAPVRERALAIFRRLIEAEAEAHGVPAERVHLHEAGATDAIVDIVGACFGIRHLGVERIVVSPMTTGFGTVACEHGNYPVPAPATLLLVRDCPVRAGEIEAERLTPTGAAILTTLADAWSTMPPMRPRAVGYGAGDHEFDESPNYLRMILGTGGIEGSMQSAGDDDEVLVIETTVDDVPPQTLAHACERLFEAGALDVFTSTVTMKKGRCGHQLTVLTRADRFEELSRSLIEHTSTLGLRFRREGRVEVERRVRRVRTPWGTIRVKTGHLGDREVRVWPEYEDCAAAARRHGLTLAEVQRVALEAYRPAGGKVRGKNRREKGKSKPGR